MTEIEKLQTFRKFLEERAEEHWKELKKTNSLDLYDPNPKNIADLFFHASLNIQLDMGQEIHDYLKKNGLPEIWPTEAMITLVSRNIMDNNRALACPIHYLAAFRRNQDEPVDDNFYFERGNKIFLRGRYENAKFTPKEKSIYDPEYARMAQDINSLPKRKYETEQKIKDLKLSLAVTDPLHSFFISLRALFFSCVIAVLAAFVPVLLLEQMDMSESVMMPIVLIVMGVAFFIAASALHVTQFIDDMKDHKRQKKELKEAQRFMKSTYPELVKSMQALKQSEQYRKAEARNHKLYEEDVAFAQLWESEWLEFCRQNPDPDFYV